MSLALSKRQQARNEKVLQDLVQNVPGNNFCADCQARNPAWASWSLGIFLCMRCAAIHRKLGTHISKVKSLSMDSWTNEQVENMRKVGNIASNKTYNPENKRPPVPVDADEADSAMERFIRSKYSSRTLNATKKQHTGASDSDDTPPPLPPKTPSRFGIRSASSIFPLGSKSKKQEPTSPRAVSPRDSQPPLRNKSSQVFGASILSEKEDTERKLAKLRDMGFNDDQRNAMILKGVGGDLERTIEALVRLGEGNGRASVVAPIRTSSLPATRTLTPSAASTTESRRARPVSPASTNPFDMLDTPQPPQPLSSQSTGTLQNKNPYLSTNPFGVPSQTNPTAFDLAFQNMSLAPPAQPQPLFPNRTGGLAQQQNAQSLYQQPPMTAPLPVMGQSYKPMASSQTYPPPAATSYNPFLQAQPAAPNQQLSVNTAGFNNGAFGNNPFTRSPTRIQSPTLMNIPEQAAQQHFYASPVQSLQAAPTPTSGTNPFFRMTSAAQQQPPQSQLQMMPQQQQFFQQPQMGLVPQMTGFYQPQQLPAQPYPQFPQAQQVPQRPDKSSIMALYNYPQLAPQVARTDLQTQDPSAGVAGAAPPSAGQAGPAPGANSLFSQTQPVQQQQQTAIAAPAPTLAAPSAAANHAAPANKNPFMMAQQQQQQQAASMPQKTHNVSRESMMAVGLEWSNGRHSPDAFASLSANTR